MITRNSLYIFVKREALLLTGASMALGFFISLLFQGLTSGSNDLVFVDRLVIIIAELAILVPPYFILKQRGLSLRHTLPLKPIAPLTFLMAIIIVIGAIGVVSIFEVLVLPFFPIPDFLAQLEKDLMGGSLLDTLLLLIAGTLIAPVVEEYLFRGVLQQSLFYRYGSILPGMIVPTVIFALFHVAYLFYLPALIELIMLALLLAWLMAKTANLFIPIIVHGLFNLSSFSGFFMSDMAEISTLDELGWSWITLSIVLLGVGWYYFKKMKVVEIEDVFLIPPIRDENF